MHLSEKLRESACELFAPGGHPPRPLRRTHGSEIAIDSQINDLLAFREAERRILVRQESSLRVRERQGQIYEGRDPSLRDDLHAVCHHFDIDTEVLVAKVHLGDTRRISLLGLSRAMVIPALKGRRKD